MTITLRYWMAFSFLAIFFMSCKEEEELPITPDTGTNTDSLAVAHLDLKGYVQKGPFINGTTITVSELSKKLIATGKNFNTQIIDNKGAFSLKDISLKSEYVQLMADGFYFDEVKGEKSAAQLTMFALANVSDMSSVNVNLLSHLQKERVVYLIQEEGKTFAEAKQQAQQEVLAIFGISKADMAQAELLDISQEGEDNAILLAISAVLQGDNTVAELSELLANIITDIREDGKLDSESTQARLREQAMRLKLGSIRTHLLKRYEELGVKASIASFEQYVDSDGDAILNKDEDDTPDTFIFTTQKDVAISTDITSNEVVISGLKAEGVTDLAVSHAKVSINGHLLTDTLAQVKNGDRIRLQLRASSLYADTTVASLSVGYLTSYFTVVTDDYKADAFSFSLQKDVAVDSLYTSAAITLSGLPYATPASIEGGILIINGVALQTDTTTVKDGDQLSIRLRSSGQYATATAATLYINGVQASFQLITDDYKPDNFSFTEQKDVAIDSFYVSNTITLNDLPYPAPATIENGILIKNGVELAETTTNVKNGDQLSVRLLSATRYLTATSATLTVGNGSASFKITTDDYRPNDFHFTPVVNAKRQGFYFSDTITISGLPYDAPIHSNLSYFYSETETAALFINGEEARSQDAVVRNGDRISIKAQSGDEFSTPYFSSITIGNTSYEFSITTMRTPLGRRVYFPDGEELRGGFSINNKIYIILQSGSFYEYAAQTSQLTDKGSVPGTNAYSTASFSLNGKGYALLSGNQGFWEYDPISSVWTRKANFPGTGRSKFATFITGNKGYIGLGESGGNYLKDIWQYDPMMNTWTRKADFPGTGRTQTMSFSFSDKAFVGSGYFLDTRGDYQTVSDLWEYNSLNDSWVQKNDVDGHPYAAAFTLNGKGYAVNYAGVSSYDPEHDHWTLIENHLFDPMGAEYGFSVEHSGFFNRNYMELELIELIPPQE